MGNLRDTLINEGIKIGAYFIRNRKPKITTSIPTIQDLEERLKEVSGPEIPEQLPGSTLEITTEGVSIKAGAEKGTACNICTMEHFNVTSGALAEALRFAQNEGLGSKEAIRRIRQASQELNMAERIDLAPEEVTKLPEDEKEVAHWALPQSRNLRHSINSMITIEDLEKASAQAADLADEFAEKLIKCKPSAGQSQEKIDQIIDKGETKPLPLEIEALKKLVEEKGKEVNKNGNRN